MSRFGIVNMSMVITEEKILSNIDKVQKLINPNSKKQIIELEEDSYFKELVESIKTYLVEYPKKKNFPVGIYKAAYGLVEFATTQFEENTKKIEDLIKQREENIVLSGVLKDTLETVQNGQDGWKKAVSKVLKKFDDEIISNLNLIGNSCETATTDENTSDEYTNAIKKVKAKINNLESNLHIEIDMERLEDSSKALSYIGIEVADALKLIPAPEEQLEAIAVQNAKDEEAKNAKIATNRKANKTQVAIAKETTTEETLEELVNETLAETASTVAGTTKVVASTAGATTETTTGTAKEVATETAVGTTATSTTTSTTTTGATNANETIGTQGTFEAEQQQYAKETTFEAKPSLWQRFKNSKFVRAATYVFRIKVRIELPSNALPEGRGDNV